MPQDPELIEAFVAAIGSGFWYPIVALFLALLLSVWRRTSTQFDELLLPLGGWPTFAVAVVSSFVTAFFASETWPVAVVTALYTAAISWPIAVGIAKRVNK